LKSFIFVYFFPFFFLFTFRIYEVLSVVNSWNETVYEQVQQSHGKLGAGGGPPRQPWAPPFAGISHPYIF